jgi:hypothetical protein
MKLSITKHFDFTTPFSEAANDEELAKIMRLKYPAACGNLERDAGFFSRMVEGVREYDAWKVIGFSSFEDFCKAELGKTLCEVEQIVSGVRVLQSTGRTAPITERQARTAAETLAAAPKLAMHGGDRKKEGSRSSVSVTLEKGGHRKTRLAARLNRDHPEIAERVKAGEFRSIRAAAIVAGIVKVKTPLERLFAEWKKASQEERAEFLKSIKA